MFVNIHQDILITYSYPEFVNSFQNMKYIWKEYEATLSTSFAVHSINRNNWKWPCGFLEDTIRISQCPRISQDKDKTTNSIDYQERKLDPCPRPLPANNFSLKGCMGSGALGPTDAVWNLDENKYKSNLVD